MRSTAWMRCWSSSSISARSMRSRSARSRDCSRCRSTRRNARKKCCSTSKARPRARSDQTVLGVVGHVDTIDPREFKLFDGVQEVVRVSEPYKLTSRTWKREKTVVKARGVEIGGDQVVVMAGPCTIESEPQLFETARRVARSGAKVLRGGAYKPRTSPYAFQGMGVEGLKLLRAAGDETGMATVSEVMEISQIEGMLEYVDILQVGARNMQNFNLLSALGQIRKPILLKRGMSATIQEWLLAAEYIMSGGNYDIVLCER